MYLDELTISEELHELSQDVAEALAPAAPKRPPARKDNESVTAWGADVRKDAKILIVDDEPLNIRVVRKFLSAAGYRNIVESTHALRAPIIVREELPDVVLLDIMMPELSGAQVLQQIRMDKQTESIPVIVLTAADNEAAKLQALEYGATDFLAKPVNSAELILRIRNTLLVKLQSDHLKRQAEELERQVRQRTAELAASRLELIHCLARAAEFRDNETGRHVLRVGRYAGVIARALGLAPETCELIELAAPLHDMGKIGIPDAILLKPGQLDPAEVEAMQQHAAFGKRTFEPIPADQLQAYQSHTMLGERILQAGRSPILEMASRIALTHHERWDGAGYPVGLAGEDIPIEGRITAVADVFDALSSRRPYKPAFPLDKCLAILEEGRGSHFDPAVLDAFFARKNEIVAVRIELADTE